MTIPGPVAVEPGAPSAAPVRRRRWPWIVTLLIVIALVVAAWILAEAVAKSIVVQTVRTQIVEQLDLPADQEIDVDVVGSVLPQLIAGRLDRISVASADVAFGGLSGDVEVMAAGVPIRGDDPLERAEVQLSLDETQLRQLLASVDGFPDAEVRLDAPDVAMDVELRVLALTVDVGVDLTPSAQNGDLVLTPTTLRLGDAEISAQALVDQFGAIATTVVRDWDVCLKDSLPAGVRLGDVRVIDDRVEIYADIDGGIIHDPALQQPGTCR